MLAHLKLHDNPLFLLPNPNLFSSPAPTQRFCVRIEIEIKPIGALDFPAPILHNTPPVSRNVHACAKPIIFCVGSNCAVSRHQKPGEKDYPDWNHPRMCDAVHRKQPRTRFVRFCPTGSAACIFLSLAIPITHVAVPEIQLKVFPASPFPSTALSATAISGRIHMLHELFVCTSEKQNSK